jgi:tetratricopeptide (TPR) repeat protein
MVTGIKYFRLAVELELLRSQVAQRRGDLAAARAGAETALASARKTDSPSATARALNVLGSTLQLQGEYAAARASFEESTGIARSIEEKQSLTTGINGLAALDLAQGQVSAARRRLDEIIPIDRQVGDKAALVTRLANLATVYDMQADVPAALKLTTEACQIHESLGADAALAACRVRQAGLLMQLGRVAEARGVVDRVQPAALKASATSPVDLAELALLHLEIGNPAGATAISDEARREASRRGESPEFTIAVAVANARIEAASGHREAAVSHLRESQAKAERFGLLPLALAVRLALAENAAPPGRRSEASAVATDASHVGITSIAARARILAVAEQRSARER